MTQNKDLKRLPDAPVSMLATGSNFNVPGVVFNKTALECTPFELFTEYLVQAGFELEEAKQVVKSFLWEAFRVVRTFRAWPFEAV